MIFTGFCTKSAVRVARAGSTTNGTRNIRAEKPGEKEDSLTVKSVIMMQVTLVILVSTCVVIRRGGLEPDLLLLSLSG